MAVACEPLRVACLGDSHTFGDGSDAAGLNYGCRLSATNCRGNYPRLLQSLFGRTAVVKNLAVSGTAATDLVACERVGSCTHTPRGRQLLEQVAQFAPHVQVVLLGTNDAIQSRWAAMGGEVASTPTYSSIRGSNQAAAAVVEASVTHLLRALARAGASDRRSRVLVLAPPPTMGEWHAGVASHRQGRCVRMHLCRYHPHEPCWVVAECITCAATDTLSTDFGSGVG